MPQDYIYRCDECGWSDKRYRNLKFCPKCGAPVIREDDFIYCFHGTNEENKGLISKEGFKPDCWFAKHMEDALACGGNYIFWVKFNRKEIPLGWQFHVRTPITKDKIERITYCEEYLQRGE